MTRRLVAVAVLGAAVVLVSMQDASAFGGRKRGNSGCNTGYNSGCDTPCAAPSHTVTYVDKKVTAHKAVWKTKKVEVDVVEYKMVDEKYKYIVCEPVKSMSKVKVSQIVETKQPYKYMVNTIVQVKEKAKVSVMTQVPGKEKRIVCETVCVAVQVPCDSGSGGRDRERRGLFSRGVRKNDCNDPCPKPCATACETPCAPVMRTVMKHQVVRKEVEVDVMRCVQTWVERDVMVNKHQPVEKEGTRIVCTQVWVNRDVEVSTMVRSEKEGTRKVSKAYTTKKTVDQQYCEMVAYETTVKVAVSTPCAAPVAAPCAAAAQCASSCDTGCSTSRGGRSRGSRCCK